MPTEAEHRPGHIQQLDFDALAALPSGDAVATPKRKPAGRDSLSDGGEDHRPAVQPGGSAEDELCIGLGDRDTGFLPAGRRRVIPAVPEPETQPSRDFRITEAHGVGTGGLHEKAKANIAAIRLVKTLEAEDRDATDEEKAVLVRYAGWGALAQVFEYAGRRRPEWNDAATELRQLLTEEEYA